MSILVIAKYRCEIAGTPTDSLDYQVWYFDSSDSDEVTDRLRREDPCTYDNEAGERVTWIFDSIVATELNPKLVDGEELIGFIAGS